MAILFTNMKEKFPGLIKILSEDNRKVVGDESLLLSEHVIKEAKLIQNYKITMDDLDKLFQKAQFIKMMNLSTSDDENWLPKFIN